MDLEGVERVLSVWYACRVGVGVGGGVQQVKRKRRAAP